MNDFEICLKMGNGCFSSSSEKDKEKEVYEVPGKNDKVKPEFGKRSEPEDNDPEGNDKPYERLDDRIGPVMKDLSSYPPITQAVLKDNIIGLKYMIEKGVDVNIIDGDGETPLMKAAVGGHVECLKILLYAGADVNMEDIYGETALMKAITNNQKDCVNLFISKGVDKISVGKNRRRNYLNVDC